MKRLLFLLVTLPLSAGEISLYEKVEQKGELIGRQMQVYEDESAELGIAEIREEADFSPSQVDTPNFGYSNSAFWLHFSVVNESPEPEEPYFEVDFPLIDEITVYIFRNGKLVSKENLGEEIPLENKEVHYRNPVFKSRFEPGEKKEFYIRYRDEGSVSFPLRIWHEKQFNEEIVNRTVILGIFYGILLIMGLYNLFLYFSFRETSYLYYVLFVFSLMLMQTILDGFTGNLFLSFESSWFANRLFLLTGVLIIFFITLFTNEFLNLKDYIPPFNHVYKILMFILPAVMVAVFFLDYILISNIFVALLLGGCILWIVTGFIAFQKGVRQARFYAVSWIVLLSAGILFGLKLLGILSGGFFIDNSVRIGGALQVLLLSFALADKINIIRDEKETAQAHALRIQEKLNLSFQRFVPEQFLNLLGKKSILEISLGDQIEKEMSVLFCDIRNFTSLSEAMTPAENFRFINSFLGRVSPVIRNHRGFIDKFIGDSIMALFLVNKNAPIEAAIDLQNHLVEYNRHRESTNYPPIQVGVGVHTGNLMLGTIGEESRLDGTVISDAVNTAARLESLCKTFGSKIITSGSTLELADRQYSHRYLGSIKVKGKDRAVEIYEIIDTDEVSLKQAKLKTQNDFEKAVNLFQSKKHDEAGTIFREVLQINAEDNAARHYLKLIEAEKTVL